MLIHAIILVVFAGRTLVIREVENWSFLWARNTGIFSLMIERSFIRTIGC